jgi:hypothetical protein
VGVGVKRIGTVVSMDSIRKKTFQAIRKRLSFERVFDNVHELIRQRNAGCKYVRLIVRLIEQDHNRGQFEEFRNYFSPLLNSELDEIHFSGTHNWSMGGSTVGDYGRTKCGHLFGKFVVHRDGNVPICCIDFNGFHTVGSVMNSHILDIFNSPKFDEYRAIHERGDRHKLEVCNSCDVPETNNEGRLSLKLTADGKKISDNAFIAFDNEKTKNVLMISSHG